MEKNWLVRTRECQILGPNTKEKIVELIEDGTLGEEDEISSGNGYWFWIKERDLLEKYLYGTEVQSFNPANSFEGVEGHYEKGVLPECKDLEYPEGEEGRAVMGETASRMVKREEEDWSFDEVKSEKNFEYGEVADGQVPPSEGEVEIAGKISAEISSSQKSSFQKKDSFIKTFLLTILFIIISLIICEKVFKYPVLQLIIPTSDAQENRSKVSVDVNFKNISVKRGMKGFVMTVGEEFVFPGDCRRAKDYFVGVLLLLNKRNGSSERWKSFVKRCSSFIPREIQLMLDVPDNLNIEGLQNYLATGSLSRMERAQVMKIYRLVRQQREDSAILGKFLVYDREKKKIFSKTGIFWSFPGVLNPILFGIS